MFGLLVLVTFSVLFCGIHFSVGNVSGAGTVGDTNKQMLQEAASYIENRYDGRVGFVSESEDNGSNVPDGTPCSARYGKQKHRIPKT